MQRSGDKGNPILVLVGMPGSGKSSVARYLKQKGWRVIRFGERTMIELQNRGLPISEANERKIREELRAEHGMDAYAKLSLPVIEKALTEGPTVIDGMYSWAEYKYLYRNLGDRMNVIAIFTSRPVRYARLARRPERPLTAEESEQRDFAEIENLEKGGPIAIADYTIINDGSEEELFQHMDRLLSTSI